MNIFFLVLYQPLYNLLIWLYNVLPGTDIGLAIIAISIIVKAILWPFMQVSLRSQKSLRALQPQIDALKVQFKDNREVMAKELMKLYQTAKVNPMSSCLPILIQLPILIALYRVLMNGFNAESLSALYPFVANPGTVDPLFFGLVDLSKSQVFLAVIAGAFQFWQTKMLTVKQPPKSVQAAPGAKDEEMLAAMNKSMLYVMPVMTVVIGFSLPGGLMLYWIVVTLVSILQQYLAFREPKTVG